MVQREEQKTPKKVIRSFKSNERLGLLKQLRSSLKVQQSSKMYMDLLCQWASTPIGSISFKLIDRTLGGFKCWCFTRLDFTFNILLTWMNHVWVQIPDNRFSLIFEKVQLQKKHNKQQEMDRSAALPLSDSKTEQQGLTRPPFSPLFCPSVTRRGSTVERSIVEHMTSSLHPS